MTALKWVPKKFVAKDEATKAVITLWEDASHFCWCWKILRSGGEAVAYGDARKQSTARASAIRKFKALCDKGTLNNLVAKGDRPNAHTD